MNVTNVKDADTMQNAEHKYFQTSNKHDLMMINMNGPSLKDTDIMQSAEQ
jgi:hypothetical protein